MEQNIHIELMISLANHEFFSRVCYCVESRNDDYYVRKENNVFIFMRSDKNLLFAFVFQRIRPSRHNYKRPFGGERSRHRDRHRCEIGGTLDRIPWSTELFKNYYASSTRLYTCDIKYYTYTLFMYMYIFIRYIYFFSSFPLYARARACNCVLSQS